MAGFGVLVVFWVTGFLVADFLVTDFLTTGFLGVDLGVVLALVTVLGLAVVDLTVLGLVVVVDLVALVVFVAEDAAVLERRGARPSIDLFVSIVYNYSIWRLS